MEAATDLVLDRADEDGVPPALPRTRSPWSAWRTRPRPRLVLSPPGWRASSSTSSASESSDSRGCRRRCAARPKSLLSNEPNIRYATGATAMPVYAMSTFVRCAGPQEGTPILFEHANSMHRSALRAPDVRPMRAWEFTDDPRAEADVVGTSSWTRHPRARRLRRRSASIASARPRSSRGSRCGDPRRGAGDAGGPPREDAAGARAPRPERCPRDGDARGVRGGRPTRHPRARPARGPFDETIRGGG